MPSTTRALLPDEWVDNKLALVKMTANLSLFLKKKALDVR